MAQGLSVDGKFQKPRGLYPQESSSCPKLVVVTVTVLTPGLNVTPSMSLTAAVQPLAAGFLIMFRTHAGARGKLCGRKIANKVVLLGFELLHLVQRWRISRGNVEHPSTHASHDYSLRPKIESARGCWCCRRSFYFLFPQKSLTGIAPIEAP
eukprot:g13882.t1